LFLQQKGVSEGRGEFEASNPTMAQHSCYQWRVSGDCPAANGAGISVAAGGADITFERLASSKLQVSWDFRSALLVMSSSTVDLEKNCWNQAF
jgi:hypothetical protein